MDNEKSYNDFIMKIKNYILILIIILLLSGCSELLPQNDTPAEYAYIIRTGNYERQSHPFALLCLTNNCYEGQKYRFLTK